MKADEFKEIFLAEAQENQEELNKLFTALEKNPGNKRAIDAIFRITHTLKANAAGMGYENIAGMAHTLEDIFSEIKNNKVEITKQLFNDLFKANDALAALTDQVRNPAREVKFRGIKTKLEVFLRELRKSKEGGENSGEEGPATLVVEVKEDMTVSSVRDSVYAADSAIHLKTAEALNITEEAEVLEEASDDSKIAFSDNIHIPVRKLDNLMNLVGELMIERDRVIALSTENGKGRTNDFARLQRITSEIQYSVMDVRLVQVAVLFNKFHRIVRDVAAIESKQVDLVLEGTENEIDRNVLQIISDSLIHLVRNAVSHGIELEQERIAAGKSAKGTIKLIARTEREEVIIDIVDDGKGINPELIKRKALEKGLITPDVAKLMSQEDLIQLIFEPGFSSAEKVTSVSGRGVGMDVVKKSIDSIGGKIHIHSEVGKGSTISLVLPSSMAVKSALLFELGVNAFAIPLSYTEAVICLSKKDIHKVGNGLLATHLEKNISIVFLNDLFSLSSTSDLNKDGILHKTYDSLGQADKLYIIVVSYNSRMVGFVVDKLLQQKEIVEKSIGSLLDVIMFISGATILGNGNVCLVLDAPSIINFLFKNKTSK